jgi:hypothetical protein
MPYAVRALVRRVGNIAYLPPVSLRDIALSLV